MTASTRAVWPCAVALAAVAAASIGLGGQTALKTADEHVAAAEKAAGEDYRAIFTRLCAVPTPAAPQGQGQARGGGGGRGQQGPPDRSTWYAEPVKVFDNLYFVGQSEYSVWAVTTSQGIIVIDTIYDYSVEAEVIDGLKKLGLDPGQIKYAIVSHAHNDHSGGAKFLQDRGVRILMSAADWDLLERGPEPRANRDMVITDGMSFTLGDTTLRMYFTPGHTAGTVSTIIPVRDNGKPHVAALWGGTLFNFARGGAAYITPATPLSWWFDTYAASAREFRDTAARAGADVLLSNHTEYDGSLTRLPAMRTRKPGDPHPYVVGASSVARFLTMAEECANAGLVRSRQAQ